MSLGITSTKAPFDQKYYDRVLLERATPRLVYASLGMQNTLPTKSGKTVQFRRFEDLAAASTLVEGQTPNLTAYNVTPVEATVVQYGAVCGVSDMVDATKPDAHLTQLTEVLGEQMGLTLDTYVRDQTVSAFTDDWYVNAAGTITATPGNPTHVFAEAHLKTLVEKMREKDAPLWTRAIYPGPGFNSYPVSPCYYGVCSPKQRTAIEDFQDYIPAEAYAKQDKVMPGEFGASHGVRWLETSNYAIYNSGATYHWLMIVSPNAYAVTKLSSQTGQTYFKDFGSGTDWLNQQAHIGWKGAWAAVVLNNDFAITCVTLQS